MVTGPARLGPLSNCTANCRSVLPSERAPHRNKTATTENYTLVSDRAPSNQLAHICLKNHFKKAEKSCSLIQNGCLTPRETGRLNVGRNITLTLTMTWTRRGLEDVSMCSGASTMELVKSCCG
jgi:hypothetical protein